MQKEFLKEDKNQIEEIILGTLVNDINEILQRQQLTLKEIEIIRYISTTGLTKMMSLSKQKIWE